jgi:tRNA wybutosine-synthesizing protein 2
MGRAAEIGEILLQLRGIRTVAVRTGAITGRERRPKIRVVAGESQTETVHREYGCKFKLDVALVMFARGNIYERGRVAKLVRPGEVVVDMFAGVGQFTLPIAKNVKPKMVYAIELNPVAFGYLEENVKLNRVGHVVKPLLGDCAKVAPRGVADRVIMGILHVTHRYLSLAFEVLKPGGGMIHYHESVPSKIGFRRPVNRVQKAAGGRGIRVLKARVVKRYSPGVNHVVIDVKVGSDR